MMLNVRKDKLLLVYSEFKDNEEDILEQEPDKQSELFEVDEIYYDALAKLNQNLRLYHTRATPAASPSRNLNNTSLLDNAFTNSLILNSKTPGISLPKFGGHYDDWQTFIDLFNKTVHENDAMSGAQKFTLLKLALKDDAYQLIKHMAVSELNYNEVYDKLCKRFSKKKLIMSQFVQQFLDLQAPNSSNKIRYFCDKSDELIRGIKSLGDEAQTRDLWLIHIILNKLDSETQQKWSFETTDVDFPSWKLFQEFLTKQADSIELCHHQSSTSKSQVNSRNKHPIIRSHTTDIVHCVKQITNCLNVKSSKI